MDIYFTQYRVYKVHFLMHFVTCQCNTLLNEKRCITRQCESNQDNQGCDVQKGMFLQIQTQTGSFIIQAIQHISFSCFPLSSAQYSEEAGYSNYIKCIQENSQRFYLYNHILIDFVCCGFFFYVLTLGVMQRRLVEMVEWQEKRPAFPYSIFLEVNKQLTFHFMITIKLKSLQQVLLNP